MQVQDCQGCFQNVQISSFSNFAVPWINSRGAVSRIVISNVLYPFECNLPSLVYQARPALFDKMKLFSSTAMFTL
jgi:hypothetical protein